MTSTNEHGEGRGYPSQAVVDLAAIRHNLGVLRAAAPGALQLATVKANAYGHGLLPVALAALEGGADWLGVAQLAEAFTLREGLDEAGVARADAPLLAWISTSSSDFAAAIDADIDVSVSWTWVLADICAAARQVGRPARVHVKIDTGMSRAGSTLAALPALASALRMAADEGLVDVVGAWSHMSRADDPSEAGNASTATHVRIFEQGLAILADAGITPRIRHLAATSGILWHPETHYDMVRVGIGLYGLSPDPAVASATDLNLVPALTLRAARSIVPQLRAGDRLVIVDNGSEDDSLAVLDAHLPELLTGLRRSESGDGAATDIPIELVNAGVNGGFGAGVTAGAAGLSEDALVLLNNDATVREGFLDALLAPLGTPDVGATTALILLAGGAQWG